MRPFLRTLPTKKTPIELSQEERSQLNAIIDVLIPHDDQFPPPSSLQLIDAFLSQLRPGLDNIAPRMISPKRLRALLRELNISAGGHFCKLSVEKQQHLLRQLEQHDPASFQALWTLANHSYYARLATEQQSALSS